MNGAQGINLPVSSLLTFSFSTSFVIKAWIKTVSLNSMMIFAQQKCTTGTIHVYIDKGKPYFRVEDISNHNQVLPSSVSNINDGQWHNITVIRDTLIIY